MSKKFILLLLSVIFITGIVGCFENSDKGDDSTTPPSVVTNVDVIAGDGKIVILWDVVSGATSYNIYWSISPDVSVSDNKIVCTSSPYNHSGLTNGITYYYKIRAVNASGESKLSNVVSATPVGKQNVSEGKWDSMEWDKDVWGN